MIALGADQIRHCIAVPGVRKGQLGRHGRQVGVWCVVFFNVHFMCMGGDFRGSSPRASTPRADRLGLQLQGSSGISAADSQSKPIVKSKAMTRERTT